MKANAAGSAPTGRCEGETGRGTVRAGERVVGKDWCVRWRNRWLQIEKVHAGLNLANKRVRVKQRAGGELIVEHKGQRLTCRELNQRPTPARSRKKPAVNNRKWKPAANHPWNRESVTDGSARRADPPVTLAPAALRKSYRRKKSQGDSSTSGCVVTVLLLYNNPSLKRSVYLRAPLFLSVRSLYAKFRSHGEFARRHRGAGHPVRHAEG